MNINKKTLFENISSLSVLQVFNYLAPLIVLPYLTRILRVEEFGAVMVVFATVQLSNVITDYGFSQSATYAISKHRDDQLLVEKQISSLFTAKLFLLGLAIALLTVISFTSAYAKYQPLFIAASGAVIAQAYQPTWLFLGLEKMKIYTVYMGITKLIYVMLIILLVTETGDGVWVLFSWSTANIIGTMISLLMIKRLGYSIKLSSINDALITLTSTVEYFWSRIAVVLYTSVSSMLVGVVSLPQAAIYSVAEQGYKAGQAVTSPINQALYPYMANQKDWNLFFKIVPVVTVVLFTGSLVVGNFSEVIISTIFGSKYINASPILLVFLVTLIVNYLAVSFGYPACAAINRPDIANKSVIFGALLFCFLVTILFSIDKVNALTMAYCILSTEIFVMGIRIIWVLRLRRN